MFDTKTAYQTGASDLSDCVLLTFLKKMHGTQTSRNLFQPLPRTRCLAEINGKRWRQGFFFEQNWIPVRLDALCTKWMLSFTSINPKAVFTDTFLVSKCISTIWGIWIILGRFPRSHI